MFWRYLRYRRGTLLLFAGCVAVFAAVFALYRLPVAAVLYPSVLCLPLIAAAFVADYVKTRRICTELERLAALSAGLIEELPPCRSVSDEAYQELVRLLLEGQRKMREEAAARYADTVEYYTVWAHQIKTPIASMRLTLQNEDSEVTRSLQSDLNRVEQYVTMVLTFLRLESSDTDYLIRQCALDDIVRPAVRRFAGDFIRKRLTLQYEPLNATVLTDDKWLGFVVEQVLSNAVKYTVSGTVTVAMEGADTLIIRDTGIGILPEDLPRVFENGYTGFNGRLDQKASGIGLNLSKRICDRLGHTIAVESTVGAGTTVRIGLGSHRPAFD